MLHRFLCKSMQSTVQPTTCAASHSDWDCAGWRPRPAPKGAIGARGVRGTTGSRRCSSPVMEGPLPSKGPLAARSPVFSSSPPAHAPCTDQIVVGMTHVAHQAGWGLAAHACGAACIPRCSDQAAASRPPHTAPHTRPAHTRVDQYRTGPTPPTCMVHSVITPSTLPETST